MEENLENFVNLLNRQRQRSPVPKELSGLPNWAQRELAKRPEPGAPTRIAASPLNGTAHADKPKPAIVIEAECADAAPSIIAPQKVQEALEGQVAPSAPTVVPEAAKLVAEILPPVAVPPRPAEPTKDIDPKRDPEGWLARFLAEETATPPEQLARPSNAVAISAEKESEPPSVVVAGTETAGAPEETAELITLKKKIEAAVARENEIEPPVVDRAMPAMAEAAEIAPLQPVIAEALASPRAARRPFAYALAAAAVIAAVALVVGAYWYMHSEPELVATIKPASPPVATVKPPPTLAKNKDAMKPTASEMKTAATKPMPVPATKSAERLQRETKIASMPVPSAVKPAVPPALAQKTPEKPQTQITSPSAAPIVAAPRSATAMPTQVAMLPSAAPAAAPASPSAKTTPASAPPPKMGADEPTWQRNAIPAPPFSGKPQIAIVIDDLGLDRERTQRAIELDGPVTLSFLAYASDLPDQTAAARRAGHELIVHVPMEPSIKPKYVSQTAGANPGHAELLRRLRWDLSRFTGYVGVNNHLGNSLSPDSESTQTVITELKTRGLLFLDSHVTGAGLVRVAAREGVPTVTRDVLLDDDVTASSVADRLTELEKIARQRGTAIAIGHLHDMTLDALKVWIASLPAKGLQLVPLTAIVRDREQHVTGTAG